MFKFSTWRDKEQCLKITLKKSFQIKFYLNLYHFSIKYLEQCKTFLSFMNLGKTSMGHMFKNK